jgi:hypothetical protein
MSTVCPKEKVKGKKSALKKGFMRVVIVFLEF